MIKTFLSAFALLALIHIGGCKKDDNNGAVSGKIKSMIIGTSEEYYTYDAQGRMATNDHNDPNVGWIRWSYTYTADYALRQRYDSTFNQTLTDTLYLNSQGLIRGTAGEVIVYDSEGHRLSNTSPSYSFTFTYSDGNLIEVVYSSGGTTSTTEYTYTDKHDYRDYKAIHMDGEWSNNLPATMVEDGNATSFSYQYDSNGRVSREIITGGGSSEAVDYTYFD